MSLNYSKDRKEFLQYSDSMPILDGHRILDGVENLKFITENFIVPQMFETLVYHILEVPWKGFKFLVLHISSENLFDLSLTYSDVSFYLSNHFIHLSESSGYIENNSIIFYVYKFK